MKTFTLALAAILLAGTAAHAGGGITFEINGQKIHVEAPRNCDALSCIKITAPGLNLRDFNLGAGKDDDDATIASTAPTATTPPAPTAPAAAPQTPSPVAGSTPAAAIAPSTPAAVASTTPATATIAPANPAPAAATAPLPSDPAATAAAPVQQPAPVAAPASATPLGVWATEENKGNVRIEACGSNLCGYADKTGEKVLINMKPSDNKWVGRIHDPDHGGNYDSTIAMKGPNVLRVQGCAFGGMFCGGQTWKRVS
jgi:hypothetical protein